MSGKTEIEILSKQTITVWQPDVGDVPRTYITYRDERGRIDMITLPMAEPTDRQIAEAVKKRMEEEAKAPTRRIPI